MAKKTPPQPIPTKIMVGCSICGSLISGKISLLQPAAQEAMARLEEVVERGPRGLKTIAREARSEALLQAIFYVTDLLESAMDAGVAPVHLASAMEVLVACAEARPELLRKGWLILHAPDPRLPASVQVAHGQCLIRECLQAITDKT